MVTEIYPESVCLHIVRVVQTIIVVERSPLCLLKGPDGGKR
jgi:hypothetical protein